MMRKALHQVTESDERKQRLRDETLAAWAEHQMTGLHATDIEVDAWLAKLEAGEDAMPPECHT